MTQSDLSNLQVMTRKFTDNKIPDEDDIMSQSSELNEDDITIHEGPTHDHDMMIDEIPHNNVHEGDIHMIDDYVWQNVTYDSPQNYENNVHDGDIHMIDDCDWQNLTDSWLQKVQNSEIASHQGAKGGCQSKVKSLPDSNKLKVKLKFRHRKLHQ